MNKIEKISRIPIKDAFKYEDKNLTPWLCENIDALGEAIGIELSNAEREQSTGNFSLDIKAQTASGDIVVIENQFGASNHDHLGKLITYLTSFEAKIAIWIVETPKQEHINAIAWLNEGDNGCDFFLVKLQAIKIGESNPAPLLTVITGPSEESKQIGKIKKEHSKQDDLRKAFWDQLIALSIKRDLKLFSLITASGRDAWIGATAGVKGLTYVYWVNQLSTRIELRIDRGKGQDAENLNILNKLKLNQQSIEESFGSELNWADLEGYRVCSIRKDFANGGYKSPEEQWDVIIENIVSAMARLINATHTHVSKLKA